VNDSASYPHNQKAPGFLRGLSALATLLTPLLDLLLSRFPNDVRPSRDLYKQNVTRGFQIFSAFVNNFPYGMLIVDAEGYSDSQELVFSVNVRCRIALSLGMTLT
jgi:hypothetical protein